MTTSIDTPLIREGEEVRRVVRFTREQIIQFARLTGDSNPLHHDRQAVERARFGEVIASGQQTSSHMMAVVTSHFSRRDDGVHLKCDPEFEAQTYEMGAMHDTWRRLGEMAVPTHVIAGAHAEMSPAAIAPRVAELLGNAKFVEWRDLGHFGPLEDPARFAAFIADVAA